MVEVDAAELGLRWSAFRLALEIENLFGAHLRDGEVYFPSRPDPRRPTSELPALHIVPGPPRNLRLSLSAHIP